MNVEDLKVGAYYLIRGGHMLRYRGLYAKPTGNPGFNPVPRELRPTCLAFGDVYEPPPYDPPVGYSAPVEDVLQEITSADLSWLRDRREQRLSRNLTVEDVDHLLRELGQ